MTNRLRTEIQEEEAEKELIVEEKPRVADPENFMTQFFSKNSLSTDKVTKALPFLFYLAFLGMVYIANRHYSERNIRDIESISKQVKELSWGFKTAKADLAYKSTLSMVQSRVDSLGLKESVEPPQKLVVKEDEDGN